MNVNVFAIGGQNCYNSFDESNKIKANSYMHIVHETVASEANHLKL